MWPMTKRVGQHRFLVGVAWLLEASRYHLLGKPHEMLLHLCLRQKMVMIFGLTSVIATDPINVEADNDERNKSHRRETYGQKGFQKRLVVLEQNNGRFTNYIPLEFIKDNCAAADDLSAGNEVEVSYRLSGRKWQKDPSSEVKYFLSAEAMSFKVLGGGGGGAAPGGDASAANNALAETAYDENDIPF